MLQFSSIDEIDPGRKLTAIPDPLLNYGLYTGAPINPDWAAPPIRPTAEAHAENLIRHGTPVRAALSHLGGSIRPGNNEPDLPGYEQCIPGNPALLCLKPRKQPTQPPRPYR